MQREGHGRQSQNPGFKSASSAFQLQDLGQFSMKYLIRTHLELIHCVIQERSSFPSPYPLSVCPVTFLCEPPTHPSSEDWAEPFGQGVSGVGRDVNECAIDNDGCQNQCCDTLGSYYCKCQAGQKLEEDGRGCEDVDECVVVNGGCQQCRINTLGTFHCECDTGYRLHADERTCITSFMIGFHARGLAPCP
ncbi:signal peptide, CUB and EGF-like domain-containing protein 2 isoform X3 [Phoca vitulina]|uniref:signal peptide, CUB and EGF-like domain-containing protein 2 isoform X3 n=1 Tax=Phoca vitulina TaxID=9720 RepID=UPI001395FEA3|nr:signal peptide, CUB and EGF-like domain-containing protein 2 isoform X3 [Phoca vitulina]XP_032263151.1 signal peptide, CUB and EGF-like domain-containing protein 2 isoform X3 [Phoca vitulina]